MSNKTRHAPRKRQSQLWDNHRDSTRTLLVDAAIKVFARMGYAKGTIEQITAEAGTSRATFYLYFSTKADIATELLSRSADSFAMAYADLGDIFRSGDSVRLHGWISSVMKQWVEIEDMMRPVHEAADGDPTLRLALFPDDLSGQSKLAQVLKETGLFADAEYADLYASVLFAPLLHLFRKHLRREAFDHDAAAEIIAHSWTDTLHGVQQRKDAGAC